MPYRSLNFEFRQFMTHTLCANFIFKCCFYTYKGIVIGIGIVILAFFLNVIYIYMYILISFLIIYFTSSL